MGTEDAVDEQGRGGEGTGTATAPANQNQNQNQNQRWHERFERMKQRVVLVKEERDGLRNELARAEQEAVDARQEAVNAKQEAATAKREVAAMRTELRRLKSLVENLTYPVGSSEDDEEPSVNLDNPASSSRRLSNVVPGGAARDDLAGSLTSAVKTPSLTVVARSSADAAEPSSKTSDVISEVNPPPPTTSAKQKSNKQPPKAPGNDSGTKLTRAKRRPSPPASPRVTRAENTSKRADAGQTGPRPSGGVYVSIPRLLAPMAATHALPAASPRKRPVIPSLTYLQVNARPQLSTKKCDHNMSFSDAFIAQHMADLTPFLISPPPTAPAVPRRFLRDIYGGWEQSFIQFVPPDRDPSRLASKSASSSSLQLVPQSAHPRGRPLIFPPFEIHRGMPQEPGQPGFIFSSTHELETRGPWSLFSRDQTKRHATWTYLGEYESTKAGPVIGEEFKQQSEKVKATWLNEIFNSKPGTSMSETCARIAVRKAHASSGRRMKQGEADVEVERLRKEQETVPLSFGDVAEAFERGEEGIDIVCLECVGYDHIFASYITEKYAAWKTGAWAMSARSKTIVSTTLKRKRSSLGRNQSASVSKRATKRKKKVLSVSEDEEEEVEEEVEEEGPVGDSGSDRERPPPSQSGSPPPPPPRRVPKRQVRKRAKPIYESDSEEGE